MGVEEDRHMQRARAKKNSAIHNSIHDIRDHAEGIGQDVRDIGSAVKDVLIEKMTDMLKRALNLGARGRELAGDAAVDAKEAMEEKIQTHPYQAIFVAAGVGLAVGL